MNNLLKAFALFGMLFFHPIFQNPSQAEELVVIQTVSSTQKTFVIRRGKREGIVVGQESLFSTKEVSLVAYCREATFEYSLWELADKNSIVPFRREQFVNFNNRVESVFTEIPQIKAEFKKVSYEVQNYWTFRYSYSATLFETISETEPEGKGQRNGINFEGYFVRDFHPHLNWAIGLRFDSEISEREAPEVDIPTNRLMLMGDLLYNFDKIGGTNGNLYAGIGLGIGRSASTVDSDAVSTGIAMVLPLVRFGYLNIFYKKNAYLFEVVFESISATESFSSGEEQTINTINVKGSVGLRF